MEFIIQIGRWTEIYRMFYQFCWTNQIYFEAVHFEREITLIEARYLTSPQKHLKINFILGFPGNKPIKWWEKLSKILWLVLIKKERKRFWDRISLRDYIFSKNHYITSCLQQKKNLMSPPIHMCKKNNISSLSKFNNKGQFFFPPLSFLHWKLSFFFKTFKPPKKGTFVKH